MTAFARDDRARSRWQTRSSLARSGSGLGQVAELALGGGDDRAGDAVPRVAGAGGLDDRLAGRARAGPPGPRASPRARRRAGARRPGRPRRTATARASPGRPRASVRATSPSPEWLATTGSAPQAAASAATIPNASGNVLVTAIASAAGSRSASSAWSSRPANATRSRRPRRRGAVGVGVVERSRNAASCGSSRPSSARVARGGGEVAGGELRREPLEPLAERPEPDDQQPRPRLAREHERQRGQQQLDALGGDQLADEHDQPVARARRCRARPPPRRVAGERGHRSRRGRRVDLVGGRSRPRVSRARSRSRAPGPRGPRPARAARSGRRRRPAGRGGCGPAATGRPSRPTGSRRCGASRRARRGRPPGPRRANGRKRGYGLTVYSSALPWILTAYGTSAERRGRGSPGPSRGGWPARRPGRHALDDLAHGGHVGVQVAVDLGVAEVVERRAPRCPRSVGDVDRQQAADVGPVDGRARRGAPRAPDDQRAGVPVARRVDPVQRERRRAPGRAGAARGPPRTSAAPSSAL